MEMTENAHGRVRLELVWGINVTTKAVRDDNTHKERMFLSIQKNVREDRCR